MSTFFVYELLDPRYDPPAVFYVGISKRGIIGYRPRKHITEAKRKSKPKTSQNTLKISVIKKILEIGMEPIIREVFEGSKENVLLKEQELISFYGRRDKGLGTLTNLTDGGDGSNNMSEAGKQKLRERLKGKTLTEIHGPDMAKILLDRHKKMFSGENNPMYGKTHTEKARKAIAESRTGKGRPGTEKQKEAVINCNKTRVLSEETLTKMSNSHKGKATRPAGFNMTEEQKLKISKARKGKFFHQEMYRWKHKEHGERCCTKYALLEEFPDLRREAIGRVANGFRGSHFGWSLADAE